MTQRFRSACIQTGPMWGQSRDAVCRGCNRRLGSPLQFTNQATGINGSAQLVWCSGWVQSCHSQRCCVSSSLCPQIWHSASGTWHLVQGPEKRPEAVNGLQDKKGKGKAVVAQETSEAKAVEVLLSLLGLPLFQRSNAHLEQALHLLDTTFHASRGALVERKRYALIRIFRARQGPNCCEYCPQKGNKFAAKA